ncbi:MAG: energy transducer TonB [Gammaproteobacteria bacterium]|nr:energy transducer TonB [Gammaproteobacteria bacterium]MCY4283312.1 energy transducer TonB [Gammaproteobacteria bacterium]
MVARTLTAGRYFIAGACALMVVFGLFWLMQYLINIADRDLDHDDPGRMLEFVRIDPEEMVNYREPPPKKPPPPDQPPPEPPPPSMDNVTPEAQSVQVSAAPVNTNINLDASGFGLAPSDGEYLPIVKVQPIYPRRAQSRGIEGYVIVEFTVTKSGTTKDIRVVESVPPGVFDRASIAAAAKFKYKPRIVEGQPIEVPGVQNKITFELED